MCIAKENVEILALWLINFISYRNRIFQKTFYLIIDNKFDDEKYSTQAISMLELLTMDFFLFQQRNCRIIAQDVNSVETKLIFFAWSTEIPVPYRG